MNITTRALIVWALLSVAGCTTYGASMQAGIEHLQQADYTAAEAKISAAVSPEGSDALLYYLEIAIVKHLAGEFSVSNSLLEQAYIIAEELETESLSQGLKVLLSNPRNGPYGGADFEKVFINYYKALNYYALARNAQTSNERLDALEGARIESRRLITRLNEINDRLGKFISAAEKEEDSSAFKSMLSLFNAFRGELIDLEELQYRDDAMAHYMIGLTFEMNAEYDDARLSYRKAAEAYENGFAKQYRLGNEIVEQAWFDTIRMMRRAGGYGQEWQVLAQKKLSSKKQKELHAWTKNSAQIVIVEEKGLIPHREEMSLMLQLSPSTQSLVLSPWFSSNTEEREAALQWFYLLYADKGWRDAMGTFMLGHNLTYGQEGLKKVVYLGPAWSVLEELGLLEAIQGGLRVPVSYYGQFPVLGESVVKVNGKTTPLIRSSDLALIAAYQQVVKSGGEIVVALGRSAFKTVAADQLKHAHPLAAVLGKLAAGASEAAETRNWLLLPQEIRVQRLLLSPGEHHLTMTSNMPSGTQVNEHRVDLQAGDISLWHVRTMPNGQGSVARMTKEEDSNDMTAAESMVDAVQAASE